MPRTSATTRTKIVDEAYRHACEGSLAALSVRSVARDCGVSVGTLYNYFPDKAALTAAVIERFWKEVAFADGAASCLAYHEGERFVDFCRRVERTFSAALADFRTNWLGEMGGLDARSRQRGRATEHAYFDHICTNLERLPAPMPPSTARRSRRSAPPSSPASPGRACSITSVATSPATLSSPSSNARCIERGRI